jgi:hypothetical protein
LASGARLGPPVSSSRPCSHSCHYTFSIRGFILAHERLSRNNQANASLALPGFLATG